MANGDPESSVNDGFPVSLVYPTLNRYAMRPNGNGDYEATLPRSRAASPVSTSRAMWDSVVGSGLNQR